MILNRASQEFQPVEQIRPFLPGGVFARLNYRSISAPQEPRIHGKGVPRAWGSNPSSPANRVFIFNGLSLRNIELFLESCGSQGITPR
jgi:hypothetical protein